MRHDPHAQPEIELSIVVPAHNEADNLGALLDEIDAAVSPLGIPFECVVVDDASTDATPETIRSCMKSHPWLRAVSLERPPRGKGNGQSAAFRAGFELARGDWIVTMDADLQNDPADLPAMLQFRDTSAVDMVQGDRSAARATGDAWVRRFGSAVGRRFRRTLLGDTIVDTGCSLRVMRRELALRLPLEFKGLHRFIPVSARHMGYTVVEIPVAHRPRHAGTPKYGVGIISRALPGLVDLFAVRWMRARRRTPGRTPIEPPDRAPSTAARREREAVGS